MQEATFTGLRVLLKGFDDLLRDVPEAKKEMLEAIGQELKKQVDRNISASVNDHNGHVRAWQNYHIGSGLGYAAVRPDGGKEGASTGDGSPGHITNALENGHAQTPGRFVAALGGDSGKRKGRKLAAKRVPGKYFYQTSRAGIQEYAYQAVEACARRLAAHLEG